MHFAKNIILALCIIFNPGKPGNDLFIKPSVYIMPREVFTNQANWEMVKKYQGKKTFPVYLNLYNGKKTNIRQEDFRVNLPYPDLVSVLKKKVYSKSKVDVNPVRLINPGQYGPVITLRSEKVQPAPGLLDLQKHLVEKEVSRF